MFRVNAKTKIYVAAPANVATGGPELLHQLVAELRLQGLDAMMLYYNRSPQEDPVHEAYKQYACPYDDVAQDDSSNILIVPEVRTKLLFQYKAIQKSIWWLSVDNYYKKFKTTKPLKKYSRGGLRWLGLIEQEYFFVKKQPEKYLHFVQSHYAAEYLFSKGVARERVYYLSDYLNDFFIKNQLNSLIKKENIVAYNPKKGIDFTGQLIAYAKDLSFVPIENMTREQVAALLSRAKVYIDFGNHPGKDRIPREACISGACIITNKAGAAAYFEDLPIPAAYKFDGKTSELEVLSSLIRACYSEFEERSKSFDEYREFIMREQSRFAADVTKIFSGPDADLPHETRS